MSWFSGARTRMQLLFGRRAAESRIDEEVGFHLEMETNRLIREERLSPDGARRRALVTFGGVTQHKEALRDCHSHDGRVSARVHSPDTTRTRGPADGGVAGGVAP